MAIARTPPCWLADLAGAWIFYTVLPAWPWPPPRFRRIARFAPWIGLLIGSSQAALWWVLTELGWSPGSEYLLDPKCFYNDECAQGIYGRVVQAAIQIHGRDILADRFSHL